MRQQALPNIHVESAGTDAVVGAGLDASMRQFLEGNGIETPDFHARQLTRLMIERNAIILTADARHRGTILRDVPSALHRTFTVKECAALVEIAEREGPLQLMDSASRLRQLVRLRSRRPVDTRDDIVDPYKLSEAHYRRAYDEISQAMSGPITRLLASLTV